ncbi:hypothetical protein [Porphyromonas uenonis]|uniref:hypothetical protein n=1 Tax=Porphyromonas uenonis TaxID=281920 RepID=UPI0012B5F5F7|nr:hypothetical protein [Porphyromonas uenonis]
MSKKIGLKTRILGLPIGENGRTEKAENKGGKIWCVRCFWYLCNRDEEKSLDYKQQERQQFRQPTN